MLIWLDGKRYDINNEYLFRRHKSKHIKVGSTYLEEVYFDETGAPRPLGLHLIIGDIGYKDKRYIVCEKDNVKTVCEWRKSEHWLKPIEDKSMYKVILKLL